MLLLGCVWYSGAKGGILEGWGVCDGGSLITALIAWAGVSFRVRARGGQAVVMLACSLVAREVCEEQNK